MQAKGDAQNADGQSWLENAVTCYLQAIRHGSAEGRGMMARILNLLSFHDTNGVVSMAIRKHGRQVFSSSLASHVVNFMFCAKFCLLSIMSPHQSILSICVSHQACHPLCSSQPALYLAISCLERAFPM